MSKERSAGRFNLWWLAALCAAPVLASYLLFYFAPPREHTNYGELIKPTPLPDEPLSLADGSAFRPSKLKGKWILLMVDSGRCDDFCRTKLFNLRQLRLTQGKDRDRIERAWLINDEVMPQPAALEGYQGTWLVRAAGAPILRALPAQGGAANHIYIIDPLGNLMMRYPRDADARRIVKDLARLLKASRVG